MERLEQFPDIPDVMGGVNCCQSGIPGQYIGTAEGDDTSDAANIRVKYLILALNQSGVAREIAMDHGLRFVELDGILGITGGEDEGSDNRTLAFTLDCWRDPDLRKFFDAVQLRVIE